MLISFLKILFVFAGLTTLLLVQTGGEAVVLGDAVAEKAGAKDFNVFAESENPALKLKVHNHIERNKTASVRLLPQNPLALVHPRRPAEKCRLFGSFLCTHSGIWS